MAVSAVITITGTSRVASRSRSRRQTAKPSMTGIMTSRRIRSGGSAAARSMAWAPSSAVAVT